MIVTTEQGGRAIDPEKIRPAVKGESDKFSWRLYRWMVKHGDIYNRVYALRWNNLDGAVPDADPHDMRQNKVLLGRFDPELNDWHGRDVISITVGNGRPACFINHWPNAVDITDWFWREYMQIGRCLFHGDIVHQWCYITDWKRVCEYCGKHEAMKRRLSIGWRDEWEAT